MYQWISAISFHRTTDTKIKDGKKEEACKESQKNIYKQPGTQKHIQIGTKTKHKEAGKRKHTRKERSTQGTNKQQINKASKEVKQ